MEVIHKITVHLTVFIAFYLLSILSGIDIIF